MTAPSGSAAVANARTVDTYSSGMCLKFVREQWRVNSLYGSAIDAWAGAVDRHPGDRSPPLGAPLFYEGGQHGHIVIGVKANADPMRGTDMPSSGRVSEDVIAWPEIHWGQKYLGWTGDLNAVDLPLGNEDEMTPDDWDKLRGIVRDEVERNNKGATDAVWDEAQTVTKPNGDDEQKSTRQILRETWQRVANLTL
jgi:hypothetical protein